MSTNTERVRAVEQTRDFLFDLINPRKTQRVPAAIRERAAVLLRHYPFSSDLVMPVAVPQHAKKGE